MPTLILNTNLHFEDDQRTALAQRLSRFVAEVSGKPEPWVMILLNDGKTMTFAAQDSPCAFIEFKSIGLAEADMAEIAAKLCALLKAQLNLEPARIYIEFTSAEARHWGWNGSTF